MEFVLETVIPGISSACSPQEHELTLWEEPQALVGVPLGGPVEGETPDM